jgi:hypothetical protein
MTVTTAYMTGKRHGKGLVANMPTRTNLAAWFRYRTGMINTNGNCTQWLDQSGNGRNLLQATAALGPTVTSDGGLSFNGSSQYMQALYTLAQPVTVYVALQQITWAVNAILFSGGTGAAKVTQVTASPQVAMNGGSALANDSTIPVGVVGVMGCVFSGTSSVYQAGGGGPSVTTTGDAGTTTTGGFTLGASHVPGNYANIYVREVAIFSVAHDAPTRLQMLRYMARIGNVGGV